MNPDSYIVAGASAEKQMAEEQLLEDMVATIKAIFAKDWNVAEQHLISATIFAQHLKEKEQ